MTTSQERTKYCLDTNFIIELLSGKNNAVLVYEEIKDSPLTITAISSVALFEILRGKEQNQAKIQKFEELRKTLEVLPFGEKEAEEASQTEKTIHEKGLDIEIDDLLIGATAKTHGAILITNDRGFNNFEGLQLRTY